MSALLIWASCVVYSSFCVTVKSYQVVLEKNNVLKRSNKESAYVPQGLIYCFRKMILKMIQMKHFSWPTYDLEALHTKIVHFIIFAHMTGAESAEIFGLFKL